MSNGFNSKIYKNAMGWGHCYNNVYALLASQLFPTAAFNIFEPYLLTFIIAIG